MGPRRNFGVLENSKSLIFISIPRRRRYSVYSNLFREIYSVPSVSVLGVIAVAFFSLNVHTLKIAS
jgi:hypothetical protein